MIISFSYAFIGALGIVIFAVGIVLLVGYYADSAVKDEE